MGGDAGDILPFVGYATLRRVVKTADTVQKTSLTRSIGTNNGEEFALQGPGTDPVQCLHPAESKGEALNLYDGLSVQSHGLSVSPSSHPVGLMGSASIEKGRSDVNSRNIQSPFSMRFEN